MDLAAVAHLPAGRSAASRCASASSWRPALAGNPKLLLLDEPAAGLNHDEVDVLRGQIRRVRDTQHVTVLLVEHHMSLVMSVSDKVVAIDFGQQDRRGHAGRGADATPDVIRAYLGNGGLRWRRCSRSKVSRRYYGQTQALHDVSFSLEPGGITTLLGANGAGKTTTLRAICSMVRHRRRHQTSTAGRSPARPPRRSCGWASATCRRGAAPSPT